jgi:hypothetical protein
MIGLPAQARPLLVEAETGFTFSGGPKWQEEILERELITMLAPIHVENSGQLLGSNGPICVHFNARNCPHPLRWKWFGLIQEALWRQLNREL